MTLRDEIIDYLRWHGPSTSHGILCHFNTTKSPSRDSYIYNALTALYRAGAVDRKYVLTRGSYRSVMYAYFLADAEDDRE